MLAVSLFSGAGGFEIGFDRAGIRTVLQAESDPWCLEVLARHWPEVDRVDDVREVDARSLSGRVRHMAGAADCSDAECAGPRHGRDAGAGVDLVYGGFPCQDVSVAGKRAGLRGDRSGLFYEFARVVRDLRPRWFAAENVPGLLSSADGADFGTILGTMVELGYGVAWRVLDGRWFGVPQRRRRVFVVGCLGDARRAAQVLAVCESCGGHPAPRSEERQGVAYALSASVRGTGDGHGNAWNSNCVAGTIGTMRRGSDAEEAWTDRLVIGSEDGSARALLSRSSGYRGDLETENFVVATLRAEYGTALGSKSSGMGISGPMGVRRLTPLECERLMGWPDEWTRWTADGREIADSHRYRMCGNGVIAPVAEWLGHRLVAAHAFSADRAD